MKSRLYEFVVVLKSSLSEAEQKKVLDTVKSWLKDVTIKTEEAWGSKALAYKIKHELMGVYHKFELETEKSIPADFEKRLLSNDNILRHLVIRKK